MPYAAIAFMSFLEEKQKDTLPTFRCNSMMQRIVLSLWSLKLNSDEGTLTKGTFILHQSKSLSLYMVYSSKAQHVVIEPVCPVSELVTVAKLPFKVNWV